MKSKKNIKTYLKSEIGKYFYDGKFYSEKQWIKLIKKLDLKFEYASNCDEHLILEIAP